MSSDTRYAYHIPRNDPCTCGRSIKAHRVEHKPIGDPCAKCGLPVENHYKKAAKTYKEAHYYVGIDGEGQGREDHLYVMLAYSNESGTRKDAIEALPGQRLSSYECLKFILSIPPKARIFSYAFNYDLTKILTDLPDESLYLLFRPELRQRPKDKQKYGPRPVIWRKFALNLIGSKFTVSYGEDQRTIWDVFKFFQGKFTKALSDWKVGEKAVIDHMRLMKDKRSQFDTLTRKQILDYCYDECRYMASLARKLIEAHDTAGLHLRAYHGAGSTASSLLKSMKIDKETRNGPPEMTHAIACGFFGGRFENRVIGVIKAPVKSRDISSAYPYQITFLPCLQCGAWEHVTRRKQLNGATTAIVKYALKQAPKDIAWAPFPFRQKDGSICFPSESGGGWVWLDEYLAGERLYPHVKFVEAWTYRTACSHRPFERLPTVYRERLRIGKEGPGIVLKLGSNAIYGKLAQSLGVNPPFQSWIWAGMTTSGTRAQILDLIGMHRDPHNLLMIATDGAYTYEDFPAPIPRDTGTFDCIDDKGQPANKPLGGWETKSIKGDMFAARPGIYFPLAPSEDDLEAIRARGVGRASVLQNWSKMIVAWEEKKSGVRVANVSRFHGAKSSIGRVVDKSNPKRFVYTRHIDPETGRPRYGQWTERPVELSFNPLPKRTGPNPDGTLNIRKFPRDLESCPYDRSIQSVEAQLLKRAIEEILEQPDGADFTDYESDIIE